MTLEPDTTPLGMVKVHYFIKGIEVAVINIADNNEAESNRLYITQFNNMKSLALSLHKNLQINLTELKQLAGTSFLFMNPSKFSLATAIGDPPASPAPDTSELQRCQAKVSKLEAVIESKNPAVNSSVQTFKASLERILESDVPKSTEAH